MAKKKILFICGSLNQTTQMHQISKHLTEDFDCFFTAFYCDGFYKFAQRLGLLNWTIVGGQNRRGTEKYFRDHQLQEDYAGKSREYDLYLICTDLILPNNIIGKKVVLVQEGMTDPENLMFLAVKHLRRFGFPRWLASTSTTGLSDVYTKFCVASEGYRELFIQKGVKAEKMVVTGIPNFDNVREFLTNDFPHKDYVLVATTDTRENFKWDNRRKFIESAVQLSQGRPIIFKFHPNENHKRGTREVEQWAPGALAYSSGNTNHMIANCHTLICQFSSVVYVGMALGKEVHSYFNLEALKAMTPIQNGGTSSRNIAKVCLDLLQG